MEKCNGRTEIMKIYKMLTLRELYAMLIDNSATKQIDVSCKGVLKFPLAPSLPTLSLCSNENIENIYLSYCYVM